MAEKENQNERAWNQLFDSRPLLKQVESQGFADVTAEEMRRFREPRLMAKIDHASNRPKIFRENDLSIFSISNSAYRIGPFDLFQNLPDWLSQKPVTKIVPISNELQTLDAEKITSENAVLYSVLSSEIINDFCGESVQPTVSGRMRTGNFSFNIDNKILGKQFVNVDRTQIEIDAGLEGKESFYLLEIKNHLSSDFNRRQLFFPLVYWSAKIRKPIRTIFLTYSNDTFDVYEYLWPDMEYLSSCQLVSWKKYAFETRKNSETSIYELALIDEDLGTRIVSPVPFPQADNFERVIDLVSLLIDSPKTTEELTLYYDFDPRQSDYYFNAARFLGLAELDQNKLRRATSLAFEIYNLPPRKKYFEIGKLLLRFASVRKTYLFSKSSSGGLDPLSVMKIVKDSGEASGITEDSTLKRRSQTVSAWANWLTLNLD